MQPKSGKPGTAVVPTEVEEAFQADKADFGEAVQVKAQEVKTGTGKYGQQKFKPHKKTKVTGGDAPSGDEDANAKTSWIEIELVDEEDQPVAGEKYEVQLSDGTVAQGTLDEKGFARIDGIESGTCQISFPALDKDAWEPA